MTKSVLLVSGCQWENKQNLKNSKQSKEKELFYSEENPLKADSYLYTSEVIGKSGLDTWLCEEEAGREGS